MSHEASDHQLLNAWKQGDQDAASRLFRRYQVRLMSLIRSRMSRKLARRVDPEDVLLSAYRSFFVTVRHRDFAPSAVDDFWPLLTTFVLRKLAHQARRHTADRRSFEREQHELSQWIETTISNEPTAEQVTLLSDEIEQRLSRLDETAREVLVQTLQGHDAPTIANLLGIHERSVRRALERIRSTLPAEDIGLPLSRFLGARPKVSPARVVPLPTQGTTTYDRYLLKQFIGAGAFSKVFRAEDRLTGETVAVKFLKRECWHDPRATGALIREFEVLRELNHPRILSIRGWGSTRRGALFLVSDFIRGMNLSEWRLSRQPDVKQIISVVHQVADAVSAAHSKGILHGDLKPANVIQRQDGSIILCDFGLARYATDPDDVPRGGTAGFLAPEQISDAFGRVTERSDVYGLGGLLYALLTGRPPMMGRDFPETLSRVLSRETADPPSVHSLISFAELDAIAMRCLAKEPCERFSSVDDVSKALANLSSLRLVPESMTPGGAEST